MKKWLLVALCLNTYLGTFGQNMLVNGDFQSGAGWNVCPGGALVEMNPETSYGGGNPGNRVLEIDDESCAIQDVCVIPGVPYSLSLLASRRIQDASTPAVVSTRLSIIYLDATKNPLGNVDVDFSRNNTLWNLSPVNLGANATITAPANTCYLRFFLSDITPAYNTLGMIIDNIVLTAPSFNIQSSIIDSCLGIVKCAYTPSGTTGTSVNWSFPGASPGSSTQNSPEIVYPNSGNKNVSLSLSNTACTAHTINKSVNAKNAQFTANISKTDPTCFPEKGSININANSQANPINYSIDSGATSTTTPNFDNLDSGLYKVLVEDAWGCNHYEEIFLGTAEEITFETGAIPTTCKGSNDGQAFVYNVSGGNGSISTLWTPSGNTKDSIFNLSAGTYTVSLQDENNCEISTSVTVEEGPGITVSSDKPEYYSCPGNPVYIIPSGAETYSIRPSAGFYIHPTTKQISSNGQVTGNYWVIGVDSKGCSDSVEILVAHHSTIDSIDYQITDAACNQPSGSFIIGTVHGAPAPYSYNVNGAGASSNTQYSNLFAGNYNIEVIDGNGCIYQDALTISNQDGIQDLFTSIDPEICSKQNGIIYIDSVKGGFQPYEYSIDPGPNPNYQATPNFQNLSSGTYKLTVRDNVGCEYSKNVLVNHIDGPKRADFTSKEETCQRTNGSLQIDSIWSGTEPFSYQVNSNPAQSGSNFSGLSAGNYSLRVTDNEGCILDTSFVILHHDAPILSLVDSSSATCFAAADGYVEVDGSGLRNLSYQWNGNPSLNTKKISNLGPGSYTCISQDDKLCGDTLSINLYEPKRLFAQVSTTLSACTSPTGTATASPFGGTQPYTYSWNSTPAQNTATANSLAGGSNYQLTLVDSKQCQFDTSIYIGVVDGPSLQFSTVQHVTCYDSSNAFIISQVSGGTRPYTYEWTAPPSASSLGSDSAIYNLGTDAATSKLYRLSVTDAAGCVVSLEQTINKPDTIKTTLQVMDDPCAQGIGSIQALNSTGGTGNLSYSWNDPANQNTATANNLLAGNYTLSITDANGCLAQFSEQVKHIPGPVIQQINITNVRCQGGNDGALSVSASGQGSLTYDWQKMPIPSSSIGSGNSINNLDSGGYWIEVRDLNNCTADSIVQLSFDYPLPIFDAGRDTAFCENDSVILGNMVPNNGGDSYLWMPGAISTRSFYTKNPGKHKLTITRNGCSYSDSLIVRRDAIPYPNLGDDSTYCGNNIDHYVNAAVSPGQHNTTYTWNDGANTAERQISAPGFYQVTVTRDRCSNSDAVEISSQTPVQVSLDPDQEICANEVYLLQAQVTNASNPVITWSTGERGESIQIQKTGTYTVHVQDGYCNASDEFYLLARPLPYIAQGDEMLCPFDSLRIDATCQDCISYQWEDGNNNPSQMIYVPSFKRVFVEDMYGCTNSKSIVVGRDLGQHCEPLLYVPTAFSPNNDGTNEAFRAEFRTELLEEFHLQIFNRWGEKLYESRDIDKGWTGQYQGEMVKPDMYTWIIYYRIKERADRKMEAGKVTLLR